MTDDPFAVPAPGSVPIPSADSYAWSGVPTKADPAALGSRADSVGKRSTWALVFIVLASLASIWQAAARFHRASFVDQFTAASDGGRLDLLDKANDADRMVGASFAVHFTIYLVAGILFIVWQRSLDGAVRDLAQEPRYSSGWVVGGWFVPFYNFVQPFRCLSDLAQRLRATRAQRLLPVWWLVFLLSGVIQFAAVGQHDDGDALQRLKDLQTIDQVVGVSSIVQVIAGVLAVGFVRAFTSEARARLREGGETSPSAA